jgi:hypothetical protein
MFVIGPKRHVGLWRVRSQNRGDSLADCYIVEAWPSHFRVTSSNGRVKPEESPGKHPKGTGVIGHTSAELSRDNFEKLQPPIYKRWILFVN